MHLCHYHHAGRSQRHVDDITSSFPINLVTLATDLLRCHSFPEEVVVVDAATIVADSRRGLT